MIAEVTKGVANGATLRGARSNPRDPVRCEVRCVAPYKEFQKECRRNCLLAD